MSAVLNRGVPLMLLQNDWHETLQNVSSECWVSCKFRCESSIHGKIRVNGFTDDGSPILTCTAGFEVGFVNRFILKVKHIDTDSLSFFIAPAKVISNLHEKSVVSLDVTFGGLCVSVDVKNVIHVWDTKEIMVRRSLKGHIGNVYKCRFFPSGIVVLTGGADMQLKIWSAETGECPVTLIGHKAAVTDMSIVDRGRNIISVSKDGCAKLWDCGLSSCLSTLISLNVPINCCALIEAKHFMNLGEATGVTTDREIGTENKIVLLGCENGLLCGVAVKNRCKLFEINLPTSINCIAFLTDEQFVVGCQDGQLVLFLLQDSPRQINSWFESNSAVLCLQPYNEEGFFCGRADGVCSYYPVYTGWDKTGKTRLHFTGSDCDPIYDVGYDGRYLYTACRDSAIRKYDITATMSLIDVKK